jgi:hypothetical protein
MSVTEVAVTDDTILVAGTYSGTPDVGLDNIPTGHPDGDGFVMAFLRAEYTNQSPALWFQRIQSVQGRGEVETLVVDGDRVFVGGKLGVDGGIPPYTSCTSSVTPGRGKAFVAMLNEGTGSLDWFRQDGFEPSIEPQSLLNAYAKTTALAFRSDGSLVTATGSHGYMLLDCNSNSTPMELAPQVSVRQLSL